MYLIPLVNYILACFFVVPGAICATGSIQADLGRFSAAIYKKIIADAKQQRFQGFRPGTIPPHLEPTYRAFTMDECARETILEAMEQNNIRPFSTARTDFVIGQVSIPPPSSSKKKSKKPKTTRSKKSQDTQGDDGIKQKEPEMEVESSMESNWLTFDDMKGAIDAGWRVRPKHTVNGHHVAWCTCC